MMCVRNTLLVLLMIGFTFTSDAQVTLNAEFQAYPTGIIPGVRIEKQVNEKTNIHLRLGLNIFDHRDLGVHDEETGSGFGFTLGASRALRNPKFSLGLRNDFWFNTVDWSDNTQPGKIAGQTKITVVQPTAELTYLINTNKLSIRPSAAFGLEWNVLTEGEPTGEGPILLIGVIIGKNKISQ